MLHKPLFITGIGTGVGKTIVSALLTEQLQADYWKPVQAGDLDQSDQQTVRQLVSNDQSIFHPETYRFSLAASPHTAAAFEQIEISKSEFRLPKTKGPLIIEGAGGLLVPLSNTLLMIDLIDYFQAEAILVIRNYLGCINHSLLSLEALSNRNIPIRLVVFNGGIDHSTRQVIVNSLPKNALFTEVPEFTALNKTSISTCHELLAPTI